MMKRATLFALGLVGGVCFANNTLESMDVGQATQMLMGSGKDCAAVINAMRLNEKSTLIDCTSLDGKHELRWRVDDEAGGRQIGLVLKWPTPPETEQVKQARVEAQKRLANKHLAEIIRHEGHVCQEVLEQTPQGNDAVVHCKTSDGGVVKYLLTRAHGTRYSVAVTPLPTR